ncbi:MAG: alanine--tRNA ligase [Gammaproteobacteria bacterium]|nr:MAG: alanine--tRNA ligase [Gammaproteobacteria bacterium]
MLTSAQLRQKFLDFFEARDHEVVPSGPLVPANDPTLLFTNAGMVQFKEVFLGNEKRAVKRAVSSQRCVRAGGKHNDLENVGYTARHHTFFEMLGNFSFGDYFKQEAIRYAWDFLTVEVKLPPERLWVTVYEGDDEAADIWLKEIGIDKTRFARIGAKDNFWSMGDTGPCGPCSEIFYDHGPEIPGGPPGSADADADRFVEIWNLVFMQYDRDREGNLNPLPRPSVDTGMGLERLAAALQGVHNNYDTDLFRDLIKVVARVTGSKNSSNKSLCVIADHIRSCAFLIADGVLPSNEGRGYVLRRIIRRAIRHGHMLGARNPFFYRLVDALNQLMGEAYPELTRAKTQIERVLRQEEERFAETLEHGLKILEEDIAHMHGETIPGETVFKLYDTYGFPVDLTADIARERNLKLDMQGFEQNMDKQRERARSAGKFEADTGRMSVKNNSIFTGYQHLEDDGKVIAIFRDEVPVNELAQGEPGVVVLDRTPFYAESGGQVGDSGTLSGSNAAFTVQDTRKLGAAHGHIGELKTGTLKIGDTMHAVVDPGIRHATVLNHSATHLMHKALRDVLGDHVQQKGSLVNHERTRFDFSHFEPMTPEQIADVEKRVNAQIRHNEDTKAAEMSMDDAMKQGAMALFGEKYGDKVRVLSIGDSTELCGGTHVHRVGDIGLFKIISETGVAAGIRRVEAITADNALNWLNDNTRQLDRVSRLLKSSRNDAAEKLKSLLDRFRAMEKELERVKAKSASAAGSDLADRAQDIDGIKVLAAALEGADPKSLRDTVDQLKNKLQHAAIVLASVHDGKVILVAGVTKPETKRIKAGNLVNVVASQVGGKGGGRPDMAQAGGDNPAALEDALKSVPAWIKAQLG